jgi:hypothetical protein
MNQTTFLFVILCLYMVSGAALADRDSKTQYRGVQEEARHTHRDGYHKFDDDDSGESPQGLNRAAAKELSEAGVDKYLGTSRSVASDYGVWTRHDFDPVYLPDASYPSGIRPDGPVCIAGIPYSVFTRQGNPQKLLIFLQGGGACWQGFYNCNVLAEDQAPPQNGPFPGVFDSTAGDNPFADYSVVYMPYCDGSTFGGDSDVSDEAFPGGTRHHRGLRNASAGMDVAADMFPKASQITVMGHSAGGVGAAAFAPFLARFALAIRPSSLSTTTPVPLR